MLDEFKTDFFYRIKRLSVRKGPLKRRLSVVFLFTGFLLATLGFFTTIILGDPFYVNYPNLLVSIMCILIPILFDDLEKPTTIALYLVGLIFFPYLFFSMGGIRGPGFMYFLMITIYFSFFLKGKKLLLTNSFLLVFYTAIILFSFNNPEFGFTHHDPITHVSNILIGLISISIAIGIIANSTFSEYNKERETIKNLLKELEEQNEILMGLSTKDQLTGVYNRRYFLEILEGEIKHYEKYKQNFHVMMIDLDGFKGINDNYGHLFGDEVLRKVAQQIHGSIRDYDIVARYGGEEFCVIVSHLNPEDSNTIAERIRLHVENLNLRNGVKVTLSIGVATYCQNDTSKMIVDRADKCLYEAKSKGKNCVVNKGCN